MKEKIIKREKNFSDGIVENSIIRDKEIEIFNLEKFSENKNLTNIKNEKIYYEKENELFLEKEEKEKNKQVDEEKKLDLNCDKKPDYENKQEDIIKIIKRRKIRIKKRKTIERENERER